MHPNNQRLVDALVSLGATSRADAAKTKEVVEAAGDEYVNHSAVRLGKLMEALAMDRTAEYRLRKVKKDEPGRSGNFPWSWWLEAKKVGTR